MPSRNTPKQTRHCKSNAHQLFLVATDAKDGRIAQDISTYNKKLREEAVKQNASCLTCKHVSSQAGIFLLCAAKNKKVRQYNYCEKYLSLEMQESPESK